MHSWSVGDHLTHRFNPELGTGRVAAVDGRVLVVHFPKTGATLRLAAKDDALVPESTEPGSPSRRERTLIERLADLTRSALQAREPDETGDFLLRLEILHLLATREAGGLGSFLGGRVRLFPHQLHVAESATWSMPVRWLLADEVGLGKTIEAALIMNRLLHTQKIERCLVVAPEALTVQWLGELWRKYHQVFTLLDSARLGDVARDFGPGLSPFDVHRRAVIALETLVERPELTGQAVKAGIDLLVVDEAQRLRRAPGHPGEPGYRAVAPIAALGRHVLLLSATPLQEDAHGFFRLLQLLRPEEFPEAMFDARQADLTRSALHSDAESAPDVARTLSGPRPESGPPTLLPRCVSSTRRSDIGGLPPRVPVPIDLPDEGPIDDPNGSRVQWLLKAAKRWQRAREKTLVFVSNRDELEMLRTAFATRADMATGVFHELLSPAQRDLQVARFREAEGPSLLISTEAGGEGRNFEFCHRLVLFDLPWKPATVEQRIGRLDRIGRRIPVEIVYFRPASGPEVETVQKFERLGIFREPLSEARIEELVSGKTPTAMRDAAYKQMHRDPYKAELAEGILARVPADLDAQIEQVVLSAASRLGFRVERGRGRRTYSIEFGNEALIDSLPGVPGGASFVGTFDREYAVENELVDFFSSGHALVEGILAHYEEDPAGRVARLEVETGLSRPDTGRLKAAPTYGVVVIYKDGPQFEVVALDAAGRPRPEWAEVFRRRPLKARKLKAEEAPAIDWVAVAKRLDPKRRPHAVALVVIR